MEIVALCMLGALLAALLRTRTPELALLLILAVALAVFFSLAALWNELSSFFHQMLTAGGLAPEIFQPLLKTVGIALISRCGAELCRDAGAGTIAYVLETAGAFGAILVAIPLFETVWDTLQMVL